MPVNTLYTALLSNNLPYALLPKLRVSPPNVTYHTQQSQHDFHHPEADHKYSNESPITKEELLTTRLQTLYGDHDPSIGFTSSTEIPYCGTEHPVGMMRTPIKSLLALAISAQASHQQRPWEQAPIKIRNSIALAERNPSWGRSCMT